MSEPASDKPADAQAAAAAAAARKARRKKTRWGADVETPQESQGVSQAGSTEIPTGSVVTATVPPQQEIAGLKLQSSVPSGSPVPGQLASTTAPGQSVSSQLSANSQQPAAGSATASHPWMTGAGAPSAAGGTPSTADEVLPGPPPKPVGQQPWGPPGASIPNGTGSAPPTAPFQAYGADHPYQHPPAGHFVASGAPLPGFVKPAADDERPPGVDNEDDAPPGTEIAQPSGPPAPTQPAVPYDPVAVALAAAAATLPGAPKYDPNAAAAQPSTSQLPGPPGHDHPHTATAPPSFPASYPQASEAYPQPYPQHPHAHYPAQYAIPLQEAPEEAEPGPPGEEEEPQAPGTEGEEAAATAYGYGEGYTDPAYAYAYGTYTDPQTGYTYPYDQQQAYGYDPSYYGYAGYGQYPQAGEAAAAPGSEAAAAPAAPAGEPGPPAGSPTKGDGKDGKQSKITPPVVQVKLPKQYYEKLQARKREEEERAKQDLLRKAAEADARRQEAAEAAERAQSNGNDEEEEVQLKDLEPEDQLLAASTPAEVRAAKKAIAAKQAAQDAAKARAAAEAAAAAQPKPPLQEVQDREPSHKDRKRRTKSRWREDDQEDEPIDVKPSKRRRASPQVFDRSKVPHPSSPSLSPLRGPPPPRRLASPRRRGPPPPGLRELSPERPKSRRPRGYRARRSHSPEPPTLVQRYTPQPVQEYEPQPAPKPEPTEEEKAAEAEAVVAAREATPEVSEEGEIPVDPEEMEEISKAQEKAAVRQPPLRSPARGPHPDRDFDHRGERDRGTPRGRDRHPGGRGFANERSRRGRGRGSQQNSRNMDPRDARGNYDRRNSGRDNFMGRPPPGFNPPMYAQYQQPQQQQYDDGEYEEYEETSAFDASLYQPASYDAPYGVYGSALGSGLIGKAPYGQYGSYG